MRGTTIMASRARVWLAAAMIRLGVWLHRQGRQIVEDEERRWGLRPAD